MTPFQSDDSRFADAYLVCNSLLGHPRRLPDSGDPRANFRTSGLLWKSNIQCPHDGYERAYISATPFQTFGGFEIDVGDFSQFRLRHFL